MGLCAPSFQKPMWDHARSCWVVGDTRVPNWTPNEVKFTRHDPEGHWDKLESKLEKKEENMLDENDSKIIVENLEKRLKDLKSAKRNRVSQIATLGSNLKELLDEINALEIILEKFIESDDDEE